MNVKRLIEYAALFILFVVIALRPLVSESYDSIGNPMTAALQTVTDPSPVRTLGFDLAILLAALGWLFMRVLGGGPTYRKTGLEWGALLVVLAGVVSCAFAGQKRLAISATLDWLCCLLLCVVLVQLIRQRWQRRLLIAVVVATGCVQAVQCLDEYFIRFDDNCSYYQEIKDAFWARQGVALDSSKVELFERRLLAHESSGFLPHSNLAGSYLTLCLFMALGVCAPLLRRCGRQPKNVAAARQGRDIVTNAPGTMDDRQPSPLGGGHLQPVLVLVMRWVVVVGIAVAIWTTKSLGAWIAVLVGLLVAAVIGASRRWIDAHRGRALVLGWLVALVGLGSLVGYGLLFDRLPHMSLTFRWQYWKASLPLIADHPLTGVGRENFGRHYLQYKSIDSPEEVANPHNLLVQAAADWGVPGLIGILVMAIGVSAVLARRRPEDAPGDDAAPRAAPRTAAGWGVLILIALSLCRLPMLDTTDAEYFSFAYYSTVVTAIVWGVSFVLFAVGSPALRGKGGDDPRLPGVWPAVAVLTFVIHDLINFALFSPPCATTFFAVLAVAIAEKTPIGMAQADSARKRKWSMLLPAAAGLVVLVVWHARPVVRAASNLEKAKQLRQQLNRGDIVDQPSYAFFRRAADADKLDPGPLVAQAEWLYQLSRTPQYGNDALALAVRSVEGARRRDPYFVRLPRLLSDLYLARAMTSGSADAYDAAISAARDAVALYPRDPAGLAMLADRLDRAGTALNDPGRLQEARTMYQQALALDDERPEWERIRGFRPREREAIQERIGEISRRLP